jgi:integrase
LKRMLSLALAAEHLLRRPHIPTLQENNTRKCFFEREQFRSVVKHLPEDLKPVMEVAYITGWRVKSEILTRQKSHVDLEADWLRLEPGGTKNRDRRMFPLTPELRAVLERQLARTRDIEGATGRIIPLVSHRKGKPIKSLRRAWLTACKKAGVPGRIPHDFRRTAMRNLGRAGVPRSTAIAMVGHKTEAVYRRYAIVDEAMLREGAAKLAARSSQRAGVPDRVKRLPEWSVTKARQ